MSNGANNSKGIIPLRWRIRRTDGRYIHCPDREPGTVLFFERKDLGSVFEGTRDYADGICAGLNYAFGYQFLPEQIIHVQHPNYEKMDDDLAGV